MDQFLLFTPVIDFSHDYIGVLLSSRDTELSSVLGVLDHQEAHLADLTLGIFSVDEAISVGH